MTETNINKNLKSVIGVLLVIFLCFCCYFMWRISMVAYRVENTIVALSTDLKDITKTAVDISRHVDQLNEKVERIEDKYSKIKNLDDLDGIIEYVGEKSVKNQGLDDKQEKIILKILEDIKTTEYKFKKDGKEKLYTSKEFHVKCLSKYAIKKNKIKNAEEFIELVSKSMVLKKPYWIVKDNGDEGKVEEWLLDKWGTKRDSP